MHFATRHRRWVAWTLVLLVIAGVTLVTGCETGSEPMSQPTQVKQDVQLRPTFTPRPKVTATPVPTATATPPPAPTATPTPEPTNTPQPTPKPTTKPKPKPTKKPPTPTTPPYNFVVAEGPIHEVNRATTTIKGFVYDAGGNPLNGIGVRLSSNGWSDIAYTGRGADPPGYYSWGLRDYSMNGSWNLCVVGAGGGCDSPVVTFQTFRETNQSVVTVNWKRIH